MINKATELICGMKYGITLWTLFCVLIFGAQAQVTLPESSFKKYKEISQLEAGNGIKEALNQGVVKAIALLHQTDGFFGSPVYKILLPLEFAKAERVLRSAGLGNQVDRAILAINRGAEDAVEKATPIFISAITSMTVTDALSIVKGNERAATDYFQQRTTDSLKVAFTPAIRTSLEKTEATRYYADIVRAYNNLPTTFKKLNPDLSAFVVEKTMAALFDQLANQEKWIRKDPAAQTTALLQKVFGKIN